MGTDIRVWCLCLRLLWAEKIFRIRRNQAKLPSSWINRFFFSICPLIQRSKDPTQIQNHTFLCYTLFSLWNKWRLWESIVWVLHLIAPFPFSEDLFSDETSLDLIGYFSKKKRKRGRLSYYSLFFSSWEEALVKN